MLVRVATTSAIALFAEGATYADMGGMVRKRLRPADAMSTEDIIRDAKHDVTVSQVMVGFHTSFVPKYTDRLESQLSTWAAHIPSNHILVAGGKHDNIGAVTGCPDDRSQTCKDAAILYAAASRAAETGAEWFVGVHEDAYVRMEDLAKALPRIERPVMVTGTGCGQSWTYHKDNVNGTRPPHDWVEPNFACESVKRHGGLCTGPAYFINRLALKKLKGNSDRFETFLQEYVSHFQGPQEQLLGSSDRLMGCVFRDTESEMIPPLTVCPTANWEDAVDIDQGWEKRSQVPHLIDERHTIILNVVGTEGTSQHMETTRMRIPTFMYEVHKYIGSSRSSITVSAQGGA
jgi:hypothetical protein